MLFLYSAILDTAGIMARVGYLEDYEQVSAEVEKLLEQSERLEEKITSARKRLAALGTLLGLDEKDAPPHPRVKAVGQARISDQIRRLMATGRAFTTREIRAELEQLGFRLDAHANPLATINAVLISLTESGQLRPVEGGKHGRKAWERVRPKDFDKLKTFIRTRGL